MSLLRRIGQPINRIRKTGKQVTKWLTFADAVRPKGKFDQLPIPHAPDYHHVRNWAAHPDIPDKSNFVPVAVHATSEPPLADVFYLHPTTFFGKKNWNGPLEHEASRKFVDEMIVPSQTTVFNETCRVFAPRYRQATFFSFLEGGKNAQKALELAFSDIIRAFDYYIQHENKGRPFFIAGHSQGALHCMRLLEERVETSPLFKQFVAAYVVGFRFPLDKFKRTLHHIRPGTEPTQTGCVLAWDTFVEGGTPGRRLENRMHWYPTEDGEGKWEKCGKKDNFGVNPISWTTDNQTVSANMHEGAVHAEFDGNIPPIDKMWDNEPTKISSTGLSPLYKNEVSATLKKDGFLYITKPVHRIFRSFLLPRGDFHMYDYALFYMDIRENVAERLAAFLAKKSSRNNLLVTKHVE